MIINLCYKSYDAKMSLEAMKNFKAATGKDMWFTLLSVMEVWLSTSEELTITRMKKIYELIDFECASQLFHCMIKTEDKSIPLQEIEDAMFRVGWLPTDREGNLSEPWPYVMALLSHDSNTYFSELVKEKK